MRISVAQAHVLFLIKKFDVSNGPSAIFSLCHDDVKTASSLQEKRTLKSRKKKKTAILFGTDVHLNNIIYLLLIMSHFVQVPLLWYIDLERKPKLAKMSQYPFHASCMM